MSVKQAATRDQQQGCRVGHLGFGVQWGWLAVLEISAPPNMLLNQATIMGVCCGELGTTTDLSLPGSGIEPRPEMLTTFQAFLGTAACSSMPDVTGS